MPAASSEARRPVKKKKKKMVSEIKRLAPRKRSLRSRIVAMLRAFFGSLLDPNYGAAKKKQSNVHGLYDEAPTSGRTRTHLAQGDVPSFGGGG
mmetsp:Transcript_13552/g.42774  ORF Transcript_13552/g.42774 Transcript_13552/m.42774 type:complete len:93 (+) Transcript_13552:125-403(+)